jgi:S1-C subfamily serine protease
MFALARSGGIALSTWLVLGLGLRAQAPAPAPAPANQQRGYLGVQVVPAEDGQKGVVVRDVIADGPGAKAGIKKGDRIVKLADQDVKDPEKFVESLGNRKPGDKIAFEIMRDGKSEKMTATLSDWPARETIPPPQLGFRRPAFLGVHTEELTADMKKRINAEADNGAVIIDVFPDSAAAQSGLKRDDVITAVDDKTVKNPLELHDAVLSAGPGKEITMRVMRGKEKMTVKATLREAPLGFIQSRFDSFPPQVEPMMDPARRIRELERKVEELEKRIRDMEKENKKQ